jgi:hypothetical protein
LPFSSALSFKFSCAVFSTVVHLVSIVRPDMGVPSCQRHQQRRGKQEREGNDRDPREYEAQVRGSAAMSIVQRLQSSQRAQRGEKGSTSYQGTKVSSCGVSSTESEGSSEGCEEKLKKLKKLG